MRKKKSGEFMDEQCFFECIFPMEFRKNIENYSQITIDRIQMNQTYQ